MRLLSGCLPLPMGKKRGQKEEKAEKEEKKDALSKPGCQRALVLFTTLFFALTRSVDLSTNAREKKMRWKEKKDGRCGVYCIWCLLLQTRFRVNSLFVYLFSSRLTRFSLVRSSGQAAMLYVMQVHLFFSPFFVFPCPPPSIFLSHKQINKLTGEMALLDCSMNEMSGEREETRTDIVGRTEHARTGAGQWREITGSKWYNDCSSIVYHSLSLCLHGLLINNAGVEPVLNGG